MGVRPVRKESLEFGFESNEFFSGDFLGSKAQARGFPGRGETLAQVMVSLHGPQRRMEWSKEDVALLLGLLCARELPGVDCGVSAALAAGMLVWSAGSKTQTNKQTDKQTQNKK